jgi:hypothetical protein
MPYQKSRNSQVLVQRRRGDNLNDALDIKAQILSHGGVFVKEPTPEEIAKATQDGLTFVPMKNRADSIAKQADEIVRSFSPEDGPNSIVEQFRDMRFPEFFEKILHDGITPALETMEQLAQYIMYGAEYSNIPKADLKKKNM